MESPKCELEGCEAKVDLRLAHVTKPESVAEKHYCAGHGTVVLDEITRDHARDRQAVGMSVDRCAVQFELVVCDARDDHPCYIFLREIGGSRRLCFPTGTFEAWTLSWELKREPAEWLGTHRAMVSAIESLSGNLTMATISDVSDNERFYSQLHITQNDELVVLGVRPSDALVVAAVCNLPVYVESLVWQKMERLL